MALRKLSFTGTRCHFGGWWLVVEYWNERSAFRGHLLRNNRGNLGLGRHVLSFFFLVANDRQVLLFFFFFFYSARFSKGSEWMSVVIWVASQFDLIFVFASSRLRVVVVVVVSFPVFLLFLFLFFDAPGAPVAFPRRTRFHRLQLFSLSFFFLVDIPFVPLSLPLLPNCVLICCLWWV